MKTTFFEQCGENVDLMGDIGARFQAVASELFSLSCYGDFILKQAFPQTASGQYLDYHAALRDMKRKSPSKASGELMFSVYEKMDEDIEIPKGTICSVQDYPYIQYETVSAAVIKAGDLGVTVNTIAIEPGHAYNAAAETITVMVNPPSGVAAVTNMNEFIGGCDDESDDALRKRILCSYSVPPTGVSAESIRESILKSDDVLDCIVLNNIGLSMIVYLKTKRGVLDEQVIDDVKNMLMIAEITSLETHVALAKAKEFDLNIDASSAAGGGAELEQKIREAVYDYIGSLRIGETLNLAKISYKLSDIDGLEYCEINSADAIQSAIYCDNRSYLKLRELSVNCYEQ
ncbi:MAG: baseplate J/gp47 family protein [Eubacterium sp.]